MEKERQRSLFRLQRSKAYCNIDKTSTSMSGSEVVGRRGRKEASREGGVVERDRGPG